MESRPGGPPRGVGRRRVLALASVLAAVLPAVWAAVWTGAGDLRAHSVRLETIEVVHPWTHASAPGATVALVGMVLKGLGKTPEQLVAARSPVAGSARICAQAAGAAEPVCGAPVPVGGSARVELAPSGLHVRLDGLKQPLAAYTTFPLTLVFKRAGAVRVDVLVEDAAGSRKHTD